MCPTRCVRTWRFTFVTTMDDVFRIALLDAATGVSRDRHRCRALLADPLRPPTGHPPETPPLAPDPRLLRHAGRQALSAATPAPCQRSRRS